MSELLTDRQRLVLDLHAHGRCFFTTHWADADTADVVVEHTREELSVDMAVFFDVNGQALLGAMIPHCLEPRLCGERKEES